MANWITSKPTESGLRIEWGQNAIDVKKNMELDLFSKNSQGQWISMNINMQNPVFSAIIDGVETDSMKWLSAPTITEINNEHGEGLLFTFHCRDDVALAKPVFANIHFEFHKKYPLSVLTYVDYSVKEGEYRLEGIFQNRVRMNPRHINRDWDATHMWSVQGGACVRQKWIRPIHDDTFLQNYTGVEPPGFGGGIPFVDLWCKDQGIAVGVPQYEYDDYSLPVQNTNGNNVIVHIYYQPKDQKTIAAGKPFTTAKTMLAIHAGDFFGPTQAFSSYLRDRGVNFPCPPDGAAHEPVWCTWGYHRDFTLEQVFNMLPTLREVGIKWIDVDDRWFDNVGDWQPRKDRFPEGDKSIKAFMDKLHAEGFFARIWFMPGEVDAEADIFDWLRHHPHRPRSVEVSKHPYHARSKFFDEHPDCTINDEQNKPVFTKRGQYFACPALPYVVEHFRRLTEKFIGEWGFDGFKIDAVNMVTPCYNPSHKHKSPWDAPGAYQEIFRVIYETTIKYRPDACIEICPCGVPPTLQWMNYFNQPITADPRDSHETRLVTKFFKAFYGANAPVGSDHVEITDNGREYATHIGCGGVTSTRFTYSGRDLAQRVELDGYYWDHDDPYDDAKRAHWEKWLKIHNEKALSKGEYLDLYDIVFDTPECHAIRKDGKMYYGFFAKQFEGALELRGLENKEYTVFDYANEKTLGTVTGPTAKLKTQFEKYLLLEVSRKQ